MGEGKNRWVNSGQFRRIGLKNQEVDENTRGADDNCWICGKWSQVMFQYEAPLNLATDDAVKGQRAIDLNLEIRNAKNEIITEFECETK